MLEDRTSVTAHLDIEEVWRKKPRPWIKITDLEISEAHYKCKTHFLFAREIERILMEKNR